eukprot:CAMPEP_0185775354 /NCGR_PEP_ID=MMETSP1174-20130828/81756_1 /TAXON_ID=35687 /ORGANISM="Dictyocha speculum, Strain CCMP1381" /LENGTH=155 /DNA_ID=CAMNT_0028462897 /DNA_START=201 /DNA_END=668 /DNA_ORIENTATION=+
MLDLTDHHRTDLLAVTEIIHVIVMLRELHVAAVGNTRVAMVPIIIVCAVVPVVDLIVRGEDLEELEMEGRKERPHFGDNDNGHKRQLNKSVIISRVPGDQISRRKKANAPDDTPEGPYLHDRGGLVEHSPSAGAATWETCELDRVVEPEGPEGHW